MTHIQSAIFGEQDNQAHRTKLNGNAKTYTNGIDDVAAFDGDLINYGKNFCLCAVFTWPRQNGELFWTGQLAGPRFVFGFTINGSRAFLQYNLDNQNFVRVVFEMPSDKRNFFYWRHFANDMTNDVVMVGPETKQLLQITNVGSPVLSDFSTTRIGGYGVGNLNFKGRVRKFQLFDQVPTQQQLRQAYNEGGFDGILADEDFILDVDFHKSGTDELTTRAGTPAHTITASGSKIYTAFQ